MSYLFRELKLHIDCIASHVSWDIDEYDSIVFFKATNALFLVLLNASSLIILKNKVRQHAIQLM